MFKKKTIRRTLEQHVFKNQPVKTAKELAELTMAIMQYHNRKLMSEGELMNGLKRTISRKEYGDEKV